MASTRRDDGDRSYTKVTRYIIREDDDNDARSSYTSRRRDSPERETIRITRRTVDDRESVASPPPRRSAPTYVERDLVIPSREEEPRSPRAWERQEDTTDRELVIRRTDQRDDGFRRETDRESLTVAKVDDRRDNRGYDYSVYRNDDYGRERDLQHYTRTAEYYGPQQPQTIIIRQEPIIIRERIRDDDYQMVRRSDVDDERSVATTRREGPRDEEYFYEKKVRERFDDARDYDDRRSRREISPHDSVSQVGARRRSYSSDDSMVYVKRVEKESSRSSSREQKKDLAAGAIAGFGAAELVRNHRKKEGKETSSGFGRVGKDIGAGAIGALAAEGIRRYRSKSRHGSRERDRSESYDRETYRRDSRRGRSRSQSRSRSESHSRLKTLGALGLGAVAVAAAASVATRKMNEKKDKEKEKKEDRRSRSRRRGGSRGSVESLSDLENDPTAEDSRNPKRRNKRIAGAGAVGAAAVALLDRARSQSRGGEGSRERSRSKIRQGLPIAVAGLGTAALASVYEKNKAKREAEAIQDKERARSRSRSANRRGSRSDARYDDRTRNVDPYVSWGEGEIAGNNYGPEYYGRPPPSEPYYGNEGAIVPAGRTRSRSRSLSRDRRGMRSRSVSSDDGRRRSSRGSTAAIGAAAGAVAASEHEKRKAERKERKARRRAQEAQEAGRDPYEDSYAPQQPPQPPWTPPLASDPYASQQGFGTPYQSQYPPPPGSNLQGMPNQYQPQYQQAPAPAPTPQPAATGRYTPQNAYQPQQPYNPQTYPPPPTQGVPPPHGYHDQFNAGGATPYAQQPLNRGTPDQNVSAGHPFSQHAPSNNDQRLPDGVNNTRSLNATPVPPAPVPAIHIEPPTAFSSTPSLDIPQTYVPPADRPENQAHNDQSNEKRVQFVPTPDGNRTPNVENDRHHRSNTMESDELSPDARRQHRRQQESNRGYEASDDTDLSPNSERRASKHGSSRDQSKDRSGGNSSRNNRTNDRSLNPEDSNGRRRSSDVRRDRRSSRSGSSKDRPPSPTESDATIDLPLRFDDKGRKKSEKGDDPVSDRIDDIIKGKGSAGKYFGNFMDGLFGPEGRGKSRGGEDDTAEGGGRRR